MDSLTCEHAHFQVCYLALYHFPHFHHFHVDQWQMVFHSACNDKEKLRMYSALRICELKVAPER